MGCGEQARSLWDEPPPERNEREQNEVRSFDSSSSGHSRSGSDPHNGRVKRRLRTRASKSPRKNRDGDGDGDSARANREGPAHRTRTKSVHAPRNARASDATYPCSRSAWRALEPRGCARSGRTDLRSSGSQTHGKFCGRVARVKSGVCRAALVAGVVIASGSLTAPLESGFIDEQWQAIKRGDGQQCGLPRNVD